MKNKKLDVVGILCGLFLVVALVANIVLGNINAEANRPKIPDTAQTYETTARGIFSDVKVETVADADGIYSVKVVEHGETPELGGMAAGALCFYERSDYKCHNCEKNNADYQCSHKITLL